MTSDLALLWESVTRIPRYSLTRVTSTSYISHYEIKGIGVYYCTREEAGEYAICHEAIIRDGKYFLIKQVMPATRETPVLFPRGAP